MPSGFRVDTDSWVKEYEEAKELAQEIVQLIQERNINHPTGGPEASRKTATARRKLGTLGTQIEKLLKWLDAPESTALSESEKNRRRDLLYELKNRREQMQYSIKRNQQQQDREALLEGGSIKLTPKETEQTAELDGHGLLQLQHKVMRTQDAELEQMEKTVISTKHIALAIGEEVDLHTRLLDDLQDDVAVTDTRMRAATQRVRHMLRDTSHWKGGCLLFVLIVTLVVLCLLAFKVIKIFGLAAVVG